MGPENLCLTMHYSLVLHSNIGKILIYSALSEVLFKYKKQYLVPEKKISFFFWRYKYLCLGLIKINPKQKKRNLVANKIITSCSNSDLGPWRIRYSSLGFSLINQVFIDWVEI
jgi:hypothetical protein